MQNNAQSVETQDQRIHERIQVRLAGKLFVPAEEVTLDCIVTDLSAGGAGLYCSEPPPLDSFIVLYIEGFGRFDGVATRFVEGQLGVKFVCRDAKRKRLEECLAAFINEGMLGVTRLRRYSRASGKHHIDFFTMSDGRKIPCEVQDVSLQGVFLQTLSRPAIGEIVYVGRTRAWVARHGDGGIGVQFQEPAASAL